MLFTDEELGQAHQLDLFTDTDTGTTTADRSVQEAPVSAYKLGDNIRYHGSIERAHGRGFITGIHPNGRYSIRVLPEWADSWTTDGYSIRNVRAQSIGPLNEGVDYGDEPGVIDLWGAGQLALSGV